MINLMKIQDNIINLNDLISVTNEIDDLNNNYLVLYTSQSRIRIYYTNNAEYNSYINELKWRLSRLNLKLLDFGDILFNSSKISNITVDKFDDTYSINIEFIEKSYVYDDSYYTISTSITKLEELDEFLIDLIKE